MKSTVFCTDTVKDLIYLTGLSGLYENAFWKLSKEIQGGDMNDSYDSDIGFGMILGMVLATLILMCILGLMPIKLGKEELGRIKAFAANNPSIDIYSCQPLSVDAYKASCVIK